MKKTEDKNMEFEQVKEVAEMTEDKKPQNREWVGPDLDVDENGEWDWHDAEDFFIRSMFVESEILRPLQKQYDKYGNGKYALYIDGYSYTINGYEITVTAPNGETVTFDSHYEVK